MRHTVSCDHINAAGQLARNAKPIPEDTQQHILNYLNDTVFVQSPVTSVASLHKELKDGIALCKWVLFYDGIIPRVIQS